MTYDYGTSTLYTSEELDEAAVQVMCQFANFAECELQWWLARKPGEGRQLITWEE